MQVYYAIGDVHGEAALLDDLLQRIFDDARDRPAHIVFLGDLIDRGPDSRRVVETVMALQAAPPTNVTVTALRGNHEQMMLDAMAAPAKLGQWLRNGGVETLASYGADYTDKDWAQRIAPEHVAWLKQRPTVLEDAARKLLFVHAGIDPALYPACGAEVRLWTRSRLFFDAQAWPKRAELDGLIVVHGHTPMRIPVPEIQPQRINVDTGACYGGPLSAVAIDAKRNVEIVQAYRARGAAR